VVRPRLFGPPVLPDLEAAFPALVVAGAPFRLALRAAFAADFAVVPDARFAAAPRVGLAIPLTAAGLRLPAWDADGFASLADLVAGLPRSVTAARRPTAAERPAGLRPLDRLDALRRVADTVRARRGAGRAAAVSEPASKPASAAETASIGAMPSMVRSMPLPE
jgi:hypothetical protein